MAEVSGDSGVERDCDISTAVIKRVPSWGKRLSNTQRQSTRSEPGKITQHNPEEDARRHDHDARNGRRLAQPERQLQGT